MKILITGATGFVGKTLVPELYKAGYSNLCLLVRNVEKSMRLFNDMPLSLIDSTTKEWREKVIGYNPDVVIHLATCPNHHGDADSVKQVVETNLMFTSLVAEAISHTECQYFVNTGTFTEFYSGSLIEESRSTDAYCPNNFYSASKTAARALLNFWQKVSKWKWVNVIPYSPYGRYNETTKVFDLIYQSIGASDAMKLSEGKQVLDFIHVDDIARFYVTLLSQLEEIKEDYVQLYLGTGEGHSLREVADMMQKIIGIQPNVQWGALAYRPMDTMYATAPIEKNPKWFSWHAELSLEDGIQIYINDVTSR